MKGRYEYVRFHTNLCKNNYFLGITKVKGDQKMYNSRSDNNNIMQYYL